MPEQASTFEGGCRCGQVRYTCHSPPLFSAHCHCRDCQYASGGGFSTIVGVPTEAVKMTGELGGFKVTAESGNELTRKFCRTCGTPILTELHSNDQMMVLKAGTLDDPSWLRPAMHIWTASGQPWTEEMGTIPKFEKNPS
ncbi:MAG: GFA family protein [Gammaproteobacteria bacterium]|nr:GFA family protein [Gammaproteobacteria bacterium]